jgi:hypothetical protein
MPEPVSNADISASSRPSENIQALTLNFDEEMTKLSLKTVDSFSFSVDGMDFDVRRVMHKDKYHFLVNATIGYMPFTIESGDRREAIKTIILGAQKLPVVRFGVDTSSRIIASALLSAPQNFSMELIFYPLTLFLQETRPFAALIGKYLAAPLAHAPKPKEAPAAKDS